MVLVQEPQVNLTATRVVYAFEENGGDKPIVHTQFEKMVALSDIKESQRDTLRSQWRIHAQNPATPPLLSKARRYRKMSKRPVVIIVVLAMMLGVGWWLFHRQEPPSKMPAGSTVSATPTQPSTPAATPVADAPLQGSLLAAAPLTHVSVVYPPWRGGRAMSLDDPRWKVARERLKTDLLWEGKMMIEFYGKVVDENDQSIAGAKVEFSWTDLSPAGGNQKITTSDVKGNFSVTGITGKGLSVMVKKEGYETSRTQNRFGFEYASFSDEQYHEPDRNSPVLFHLRKKGKAEALRYREQEIKVRVGHPLTISIDGSTRLQFTLNSNVHPKRGKWEAEMIVENGGVVPAREEFIVEAPATGYEPRLTIGPETPKPPTWQLYQGGSFYLKLGENYGRLDIEMIPGNDFFRLKTWLNPNPGSRNLEYDPGK